MTRRPVRKAPGINGPKLKVGPLWFAVASGVVFLVLLGVRLDVFRSPSLPDPVRAGKSISSESWMNILQNDRKIGYSHRSIIPQAKGYDLTDTTFMRLNTMNMVQDLHIRTTAVLNADLTLAEFEFSLRSNLFDFKAHGQVRDQILSVTAGGQETEIPMTDGVHLSGGILDAAWKSDIGVGESRTFAVFDPATLGQRPVRVTAESRETIQVMGRPQKTLKLSVDYMGTSQTAWIGEDGSVLKETGLMGITLTRVTQKEAFDGLTLSPSEDLTFLVSVPANERIAQPDDLKQLRLKITGMTDEPMFLDGGRQTFTEDILTIVREQVTDPRDLPPEDLAKFLGPTPFIESNHPDIIHTVSGIVSPGDTPLEKIEKITDWIQANIERRPVLSVPSAWQTLDNRMGDCNEHAVLLAAMARTAGVPAQIEAGLVYLNGRFYYHAWNALYLDRWITVDALMNQIPADVTHIRFVRGEPSQQIDLMGVIGSIGLTIVDKI